jgi:tetratricopeptide (TPR) repeat protein
MRKRTLNFKLVLLIVGSGMVLGLGGCLVYHLQRGRAARALLHEADRAEARGDDARAARALERYLTIRPRNLDALARYGLSLERMATNPRARLQAFLTLEQVLRREPGRDDVRRRLVAVAMDLGRYLEARSQLEVLQKSAPRDGVLEDLRAQCEEALGAYAVAASWYEKATVHAPQRRETFLRLAALLRTRLQSPEGAERALDALVAANPGAPRVYLDRAAYRRRFHISGAEADLQQAKDRAPDDPDVLLELARSARDSSDFEVARQALERGRMLAPRDPRFVADRADLEVRAGRPEEAIVALRRGLDGLPDSTGLLWSLAELLARRGDVAKLPGLIRRLGAAGGGPGPVDYLEAWLCYNRGEWSTARALFERVRPAIESSPALTCQADYLLGQCFGRLGAPDQQLAAFRRAVTVDPKWAPARLALAALTARSKPDKAIEEYRAILPEVPEARLPLVRLLIERNLSLPGERNAWEEVDRLLAAAPDAPDALELTILRAEAEVARGRSSAAQAQLEAVRNQHPGRVEPWLALVRLAARVHTHESALSLLDAARRQFGDCAPLRLERARIEAARGGAEAAKGVEEQAKDLDRFSPDERRLLLAGLATEALRIGAKATARHLWLAQAEQEPSDLSVRLILLDLALQDDDEAALQRLVGEIRRIEGRDGPVARYAEARHLIWRAGRGDPASVTPARALLTTLASRRPDWSLVPLALAELDEIGNDTDGAIKAYLHAIDLGERSPQVIRRVARHLLAGRRYTEADRLLRSLPESQLTADDLLTLAVEVALRAADFTRALDLSRKVLAAHPDDPLGHLALGQALGAVGRTAEAEAELRRAITLAGPSSKSDAWVELVGLLARTGQPEKAEATIHDALRTLPNERSAPVLAACYEASGRLGPARAFYEKALASHPDELAVQRSLTIVLLRQGDYRAAEERLRALMGARGQDPGDAAWARRTLAMVLTIEGGYTRLREALTLMDHCAAPDDQRALAHVLVALKSPARIKEAIKLLERLAEQGSLTDEDQFLLSQLYESAGAWHKARQRLQALLAAEPKNAAYLARFAELAWRHGRSDEARLLADRLERLEPRAFRTVEIKARILAEQGLGATATHLIEAHAEGPDAEIGRAATLLEELGRFDEAETLQRRAVEVTSTSATAVASEGARSRGEALLELAEFLGRRDRRGEALDLCERAWQAGDPDAVARSCASILAGARGSDHATRRAARRLEEMVAEASSEAPAGLLASLAAVREIQGRLADAKALYRQAIANDAQDAVATNNLAWLIALTEGATPAALDLINRAIERSGPDPELLDTRAIVYLTAGQPGRALADLNEAIAAAPSAAKYFHRAQVHLRNGRPDDIARDLGRMEQAMDRESRRQIVQEETFRAAGNHPVAFPAMQELNGRRRSPVAVGAR